MTPEKHTYIELAYVLGKRSNKQMFDNSWMLLENLRVTLSTGDTIVVPSGFRTDLSSIPEFMWGLMKPYGDFILAPIVHDCMYRTNYKADELGEKAARKFADDEMYWISSQVNKKHWYNRLDNWLRWKGCRIFGAKTYKK
jgi:hypothetical protein